MFHPFTVLYAGCKSGVTLFFLVFSSPEPLMCIQNLVSICLFFLEKLSKNQILTSIKVRNSVTNLQKTMIHNTNIDLVIHTYIALYSLISYQMTHEVHTKIHKRQKQIQNITFLCLSIIMCIQYLVLIGLFVFKILSKN